MLMVKTGWSVKLKSTDMPGFLKSFLCGYVCVCMYVYVPTPEAIITSEVQYISKYHDT